MNAESYNLGARAMFDYLMSRAAMNYSFDDKKDKELEKINDIVRQWATDGLDEIDPKDYQEWVSIDTAYKKGMRYEKDSMLPLMKSMADMLEQLTAKHPIACQDKECKQCNELRQVESLIKQVKRYESC